MPKKDETMLRLFPDEPKFSRGDFLTVWAGVLRESVRLFPDSDWDEETEEPPLLGLLMRLCSESGYDDLVGVIVREMPEHKYELLLKHSRK